ncbi:MAG: acyloxyacyl hydrolase [Verrucomicrobiales bacterium]|jgi:opacity protein-like surface antigen|nr:acyloxyacyl hydrolase [Verrucomicrobiales bacterium]
MHKKHLYSVGKLLAVGVWLFPLAAQANPPAGSDLDKVAVVDKTVATAGAKNKDWSLELSSGAVFSNIRSAHLDGYTYLPINLTAALKLDEIGANEAYGGIFRGYPEFFFRGYWNQIVSGHEHRIIGVTFGPRYNFVQPGWKLVPFVEAGVGVGFIDSNPIHGPGGHNDRPHGLGQDFNFTFTVALGTRYDINDTWYVRAAVFYQHFSNAGLSEPGRNNRAIDAVGPEFAVGANF